MLGAERHLKHGNKVSKLVLSNQLIKIEKKTYGNYIIKQR